MNNEEIISCIEEIIHYTMYTDNELNNELNNKLNEIINCLNTSKNIENDILNIIDIKNKENEYLLERYISIILNRIKLTANKIESLLKLDLSLSNKLILWNKLKNNEKLDYIKNNSINDDVLTLINYSISSKKNNILSKISKEIIDKIPKKSLKPNISTLKEYINNKKIIEYIYPYTITEYILKYHYLFNDFNKLLKNNSYIIENALDYSLKILDLDKEKLNNMIKDYPYLITKLNPTITISYIDNNLLEQLINNSNQDISNSAKEILMSKDYTTINTYFNLKFISNTKDFSISIFPFNFIDEELTSLIINNYNHLKKFKYQVIVKIVKELATEEEQANLLRNNNFINEIPPIYLQEIINNMNFKTVFNMLQNINLLNKINNLNIETTEKDNLFIPGFLDSPTLVNKSNHNMLLNMVMKLSKEDTINYLNKPYIYSKLKKYELIKIMLNKKINLFNELDKLLKIFNTNIVSYYINEYLKDSVECDILINEYIFSNLLHDNLNNYSNEDIENIKYLFQKIAIRGITTTKCYTIDLESFKSIIASYKLLGFNNTNKIYEIGNSTININKLNKLKKYYIKNFKNKKYTDNNSIYIKTIEELKNISLILKDKQFIRKIIFENEYLNDLINIMNTYNYSNYINTIETFENYIDFLEYDENAANEHLKVFIKNFCLWIDYQEETKLTRRFNQKIVKNYEFNSNTIYKEQKNKTNEFIISKKLEILINTLTTKDEKYQKFFNIDIKKLDKKIIKYQNVNSKDYNLILNKILINYINNEDITTILEKLNYQKPAYYELHKLVNKEQKYVENLNNKLNSLLQDIHPTRYTYILNYLAYNISIPFTINPIIFKELNDIKNILNNFNGKVNVGNNNKLEYSNVIELSNYDTFIYYDEKVKEIEKIINKIIKFSDKYIYTEEIKAEFKKDLVNVLNEIKVNTPITNKNANLNVRKMSLNDFKLLFKDLNLNKLSKLDDNICNDLEEIIPYIIDNYFDDYINKYDIIFTSKYRKDSKITFNTIIKLFTK